MHDPIDARGLDAAWCRWVACFVSSPKALIASMASALRSGGVAVFVEMGRADLPWTVTVLEEFEAAERDPRTLMVTPVVLEVIAEKVKTEN